MDSSELTEEELLNKVVMPIVLGMFANHEWDSIAITRDPADRRRRYVRVVVAWEAADILIDYPGNTDSIAEMQQRLIAELKEFIAGSEFACRREEDWEPDIHTAPTMPALVLARRPDFDEPSQCSARLRRTGARSLRLNRRRCRLAHRRD